MSALTTNDPGRERCLALAHEEGVRLFDAHNVATGSAAAAHFERNGFVILLDALSIEQLVALQSACVEMAREKVSESKGNRGAFRYSLGRTSNHESMTESCLGAVDTPAVRNVLNELWQSSQTAPEAFASEITRRRLSRTSLQDAMFVTP